MLAVVLGDLGAPKLTIPGPLTLLQVTGGGPDTLLLALPLKVTDVPEVTV
jgi:hypothetical protein